MNRFLPLSLVVALALVLALATSVGSAATYTDTTNDYCKTTTSQFCGADISEASDSVSVDGTVHLTVTHNDANCQGAGGAYDLHNRPRFAIFTSATATPSFTTQ